jgi:signal transduction histidine kinase
MESETGTATARKGRTTSFVRMSAKRAPHLPSDAEGRARELLTMAAHDLRSPLAAIKMRANQIAQRWQAGEEPTSAEWAAVVIGVTRATDDAFDLIDDFLALERLVQRDGTQAGCCVIDVESVIQEAIAHQRDALAAARCMVTVHLNGGLENARGRWDRGYLLRILGNLLRNTALHGRGAPIDIALARRGDRLGIVVADRGPGLPDSGDEAGDQLDHVDAGTASHGIGLWIVRRAVERLNGRLGIRNTPGCGVAFDIELPGLEH